MAPLLALIAGGLALCLGYSFSRADDAASAGSAAAEVPSTSEVLSALSAARSARGEGGSSSQEMHEYQAEVTRLMDIIINSLYTQRDVFLRELISNSVDALEKARFLSISGGSGSNEQQQQEQQQQLAIHVEADPQQKVLSICDTGVGMTKQELITNLGTVAKSGTSNFLEALASSNNDVSLIGQFGVGFYSAFLVADRVTVISKNREDEQYVWESSADAKYYVEKDPRGNTLQRGTCVLLHLKEDATEFLDVYRLRELISRYSQFMSYPIYLKTTKTVSEEVPVEEEEETAAKEASQEGQDDAEKEGDVEVHDDEEEEKDEKDKKKTKTVEKEVETWEQINQQKAIWLRPKEDVTEAEYTDFYKSLTKDWSEPLVHMHFNAEGEAEFRALLFIPKRSPADVFTQYFGKQTSIKLYVRRVLVADVFDDMLPKYLHFVRGVIDSDDLPLNVSREQLQQHKILGIISKKVVRKTLDTIRKMFLDSAKAREEQKKALEDADDEEKKKELKKQLKEPTQFDQFYKEFSRNLMLGCYEDDSNRSKIAKVLQFFSTKSPTEPISLELYIQRMKEGQSAIYYAAGETVEQLLAQPQMQIFRKKDIEVLLLIEAMDEPCVQRLGDFDGKKFESVQKGNLTLVETADEKKRYKRLSTFFAPLLKWLKSLLGPKVTKVELSKRLVEAPCAVVASQWGYSAQMEKVMKTQTFADPMHIRMMQGQKIFEVNPSHKVMQHLLSRVKEVGESGMADADKALAEQLFGAAMLASGFDVEKPADLAAVLYQGLAKQAGVDTENPLNEDLELPEEEEAEDANQAEKDAEESGLPDDILNGLNFGGESMKDEL
ncbi:heat shock protein 90 [Cyclospora cayetanensis]|uniref:Heat shock protein 90 n=1 Tax=Cyclospora cayetanensis TaxID=88456 RepID=A0A6P6RZG2_9EIME|nr:heat shock protein 90 [Cyclospora cayetanensis]